MSYTEMGKRDRKCTMKCFLGYIGFALMFVLIFKGCNAPADRPLAGCHGIYFDSCGKEIK